MRFTTALVAGLFAVAYAAETTTADSTTVETPSITASISPEQSSMIACLDACTAGDVACEAKCVPVPNPDPAMISSNQACIAACPQGNGTEADINAYSNCVTGCIATYYYTASGELAGATTATGASGSGATGGASGSGSAGSTGTSTGGGASSTDTSGKNGAGVIGVSTAGFGLAVFLAAFAAL